MPDYAGRPGGGVTAAYLAVALLWSTTPLAINWSLDGGLAFSLFARTAVGVVCALALLRLAGAGLPLTFAAARAYLIGGTSLAGTLLCVYWGAQFVHSGLISVVFGLSPFVTSLIAALWLGERSLTPAKLAGMALALGGLAIVFAGDDLGGERAVAGLAVMLVAVLINAVGLVGMKRASVGTPPLAITAGIMLVSLPLFGLAWFVGGGALPGAMSLRGALSIAYLGVFGSVAGFALYYYLMKHLSAGALAMITVITPMLALLLGHLLNGEALPPQTGAGAVVLSVGLYLYSRTSADAGLAAGSS